MRENELDEYNIDNTLIFLEKLITLYDNRQYDELRQVLTGSSQIDAHKLLPSKGAKYIDEDTIINVRIKTDEETLGIIDILYNLCKDENIIISLNNKMMRLWLYEMESEMSKFFFRAKLNGECKRDYYLTLKMEKKIWDDFAVRCGKINVNFCKGFKTCLTKFLEQKSQIYCD